MTVAELLALAPPETSSAIMAAFAGIVTVLLWALSHGRRLSTIMTVGSQDVLTNESILSMVGAGLDESVILLKIGATPSRFDTRTEALIGLKQAGVSDRILAEMIGKK